MKRTVTWTFASLLLWSALTALPAQTPTNCSVCGDYEGHIDFGNPLQPLRVHLRLDQKGEIGGTLDLPTTGRIGLPLVTTHVTGDSVSFTFAGRSGVATFASVRTHDNALVGAFTQAGASAPFYVVRALAPDLALNQVYAGSYRLGADRYLDMGPFSEDGNRIGVFDSRTLRYHVLNATSNTEFFTGPSVGTAYPKRVRITFVRNAAGTVTGLRWKDSVGERFAPKVARARSEPIVFTTAGLKMKGTLTIPADVHHPGVVVLASGSGPATRPTGYWPYFLARQGIATLTFDKRGAGESEGDWKLSTYDDLADDLVSAIAALRMRTDLDTSRIGIWGNSESGWTAPLAAAKSPTVKFLIIRSGSALPVRDAVALESEMKIRDGSSLSEDDVKAVLAVKLGVEAIALTKEPWDSVWPRIDSAYIAARDKPWVSALPQAPKDHWFWQWWRLRGAFDPAPALSQVHIPVLVLLGDQDCCMPVASVNAETYRKIFAQSGNRDVSVRVLRDGSHGLMRAKSKFGSEGPRLTGYVPGYLDGIATWLREHRLLGQQRGRT